LKYLCVRIQNCFPTEQFLFFKNQINHLKNLKNPRPLMHLTKKPAILILALFASVSFIFANNKHTVATVPVLVPTTPIALPKVNSVADSALFSELHLSDAGLSPTVFHSAFQGFERLDSEGAIKNDGILTIVDFSQPSSQKRLYVVDLENKRVLFNTLVAHGRNSGTLMAQSFSNDPSSLKSSPGFYVTENTYIGHNGYSLRLNGLEKDINDNALSRSIVLHGAPYVDESAVHSLGFLGRSWGCPAVPEASHKAIINTIKDGTCLFIYSPEQDYLLHSPVLNS
jgi:L,D-transpeptidase catalytic domain